MTTHKVGYLAGGSINRQPVHWCNWLCHEPELSEISFADLPRCSYDYGPTIQCGGDSRRAR